MKSRNYIGLLLLALILINSCKKDDPQIPVLVTSEIYAITSTTAISGGTITNDGGAEVTVCGVCWSKNKQPTLADYITIQGTDGISFSSNISGLIPGTQYYVRAYATNCAGTGYGNEMTFITDSSNIKPVLFTQVVTDITYHSAISGGMIIDSGGSAITVRGVCWSNAQNPSLSDAHTTDGGGTGFFTSSISGLNPDTLYYVRAYATNSSGTAYGDNVLFITLPHQIPCVTTASVTDPTQNSATGLCSVTSDGGSLVTDRGMCWGTSLNPTINDAYISSGSGTGSYASQITCLNPNKLYYARAYATNSIGTAYGDNISFLTLPAGVSGTMSDIDGNVYQTITIGTKTWMAENLKVTHYSNSMAIPNITVNWGNLSTGAYCWYNNDEAAYKDTYGALYNYYAVYDSNHLCPTGWHIPNYSEWIDLTRNLGGDSIAGGKMKEACTKHWAFPNAGASNESGFTALPGGYCNSNGLCYDIGKGGHWWCLKEFNNDYSKQMIVSCQVTAAYITNVDINVGISVRCVKD